MDFFGIGPLEIVLILIVALLVLGPHKIPEIGRTLGKTARAVKKATFDLTAEVTKEIEATEKSALKPEEDTPPAPEQETAPNLEEESPLSPEEEVESQERHGV